SASTMPTPESRSVPDDSISSARALIASYSVDLVKEDEACSINAAIAAACGAAADVPQNVPKPGVDVATQSAAAMSGFCTTSPPEEEKFPGVIAVPSGL